MKQASASLAGVISLAEQAKGEVEQFVTQLVFHRPTRMKRHVASAACLFVDLDLYSAEVDVGLGCRHTASERALEVVSRIVALGVPEPSYIIASGRGLHLKWLHERLPKRALPRWEQVIGQLVRRLKRLGADPCAKDVSRVLRVVGSVHAESGEVVREVWRYADEIGGVREYRFDELARALLPKSRADACRKKKRRRRPGRSRAGDPCRRGVKQLWEPRLADLRRLAEMRGWDVRGVPDGRRVPYMFLQVVALSNLHVGSLFDRLLQESADVYVPHWSEDKLHSSLAGVINRVGTAKQFRFRTGTIIEMLDITPEEQLRLSVLRRRDRAEWRRESQRARRRRSGVQDIETLEARRRELGVEILRMRSEGATWNLICAVHGLCRSTANRYLKLVQGVSNAKPVRVAKPEAVQAIPQNDHARSAKPAAQPLWRAEGKPKNPPSGRQAGTQKASKARRERCHWPSATPAPKVGVALPEPRAG